jgi:hypothetical protein
VEVGIASTKPPSYRGHVRRKPILLALIVSAFFALNLPGASSAPPTLVAPVLSASATGTEVSLTWTDAGRETAYHVMRLPPGAVTWTEIATPRANTLQYRDSGLFPSTTYHYVVVATRGWKQMNSNAVQVTTGVTPSLPPPSPSPSPSLAPSPSPSPSPLPSPSPSYSPSPLPSPSPSLSPSPSPSPTLSPSGLPIVGPQSSITCPAGSVNIGTSTDIQAMTNSYPQGTTFCLKAGTHSMRAPVVPKSNDTYVGEYGAILDGTGWTTTDTSLGAAFSAMGRDSDYVTIRNLVIRNMPQRGIATAYGANSNWTIDHNEISGSVIGVAFPDYSTVTNNFIHHNAKYGYTGYRTTGSVFRNNEVSHNDTCLCYPADGGASKLAGTTNDSIIGNYIHDNGGNGIWFDTNNTGVLIEGNTVSVNMKYGKAISMEQNTGTAVIRNNRITVGSGGEVAIRLNNSSNVQIYNNTIATASLSGGGAIHLFFDASRTGYDTANNQITNNTISLQGSATVTAGVTCSNVTDCSPYWTTKGNIFQGNTYRVPSRTGRNWALSSAVAWLPWQAVGFDTTGSLVS